LLRDLAGQTARALGPQIRLHGRSAKGSQQFLDHFSKAASLDQDEAGYVDHPVDGNQCSGCTMFRPPAHCTLVRGQIAPDGHCEYFDPAANPVITLSPLVGNSPDSAVSGDEDAERRRHDGFLATAALILAGAPIGDWQSLRTPATAELEGTYAGSARGTLKLLGELDAATGEQMDRAAAAWARENAGELVGQLEKSTRGMLAEDVARAVEEGWTDAQLTNHFAESYAFSETRAKRIAQNELAVANRAGARLAIRKSNRATGRAWVTAGDDKVEEDCRANEAASPIGIDEEFPNGDDPHVGCRCAIIPWTEALDEENALAAIAKAGEKVDSDHIDPEHAVPVSLPLADPITEANIQHSAWTLVREILRALGIIFDERIVPVDDLVATQAVVDSERVAEDEADYRDHGQGDHLPLVVERDGLYYVLSGHHHTEGAIDAGATELQVEIMSGEV
jgi:hypothetical protein